jgi:zinc transport system ATP-binding protein
MTSVGERPSDATPLVAARALSFRHGDRAVLNGVDIELFSGEMCALVGPNGSGKTTLVRLLLGLLSPQDGEVDHPRGQVTIGYVPQRTRLDADVPATVFEMVASGLINPQVRRSKSERHSRILKAIADVGLADRATSQIGRMSGGQQQRALIARAIVRDPQLLVLDEPVAGVDTESQHAFHDVLAGQLANGTSVLLVSHELSAVADLVQRVVVLRHHLVEFDGPPADLEARGISLGVHAHDLPVWLERR